MSEKIITASILGAAIVIASIVLALGMSSLGDKIETAGSRSRTNSISISGDITGGIPVRIEQVK